MQLEVKNITKRYGQNLVLDSFSYTFTPGIYGFLGPNGVGKTTLINLLTDNLKADDGQILYDHVSIKDLGTEYRKKIGFMPQQQNVYPYFTVERFLWYMAGLKGLSKAEAKDSIQTLLKQVNLEDKKRMKLGQLSGGMKQRALLAQALLGKPEVIFLDEPTAGLDPKERIRMRNLIAKVGFDCIIFITTHVVQDIQFIAKEIIVMGKGNMIASGSPGYLCSVMKDRVYEIEVEESAFDQITEQFKVVNVCRDGELIRVRVLSEGKPTAFSCQPVKPDLEDLYLHYFE